MPKLKIGIVADNYKIPKFEQELTAKNIEYYLSEHTADLTTITLWHDDTNEIKVLCEKVEFHFKRSN